MASVLSLKSDSGKPSAWEKIKGQPYLYRYIPKGSFYLRGRFGGEPIKLSLQTTDFSEAVRKLDLERVRLREIQGRQGSTQPPTLAAAMGALADSLARNPSLKATTRQFYAEAFKRMLPGMKHAVPGGEIALITPRDMAEWWGGVTDGYAPRQANQMLMIVRRAVVTVRKKHPFLPDPAADLKRVKVPRTRLELLSLEQFNAVVADLRVMRPGPGREAADYVEFMAYSGQRPGEIAHLEWRDINEQFGVIQVWGGPDRTKNGEMRLIPIIPAMSRLLAGMRERSTGTGKLFANRQPRRALKAACARLGLRHQRIYDLRHLFATTCMESGVDVPTFAAWLGHKDGGTLALKTYVQNRNEHRDRMAAKVTFG